MHRPGRGGNSGCFADEIITTGATPLLRAAAGKDSKAYTVSEAKLVIVTILPRTIARHVLSASPESPKIAISGHCAMPR